MGCFRGPCRRRKGRKKERERARRMAGMGLDPRTGQARNIDWRDPIATNAPSAHLVMCARLRLRLCSRICCWAVAYRMVHGTLVTLCGAACGLLSVL